jgi:hypothetical protein
MESGGDDFASIRKFLPGKLDGRKEEVLGAFIAQEMERKGLVSWR